MPSRLARTAAIAALSGAAALTIGQTTPRLTPASAAPAASSGPDGSNWQQAGPFGWQTMAIGYEGIVNDTGYTLDLDTSDLSTYQTWFVAPMIISAGQTGYVQINAGYWNSTIGDNGMPENDYANIVYDENGVPVDFHLQGSGDFGDELNGVDWSVQQNGCNPLISVPDSHMEPVPGTGAPSYSPPYLPDAFITIGDPPPMQIVGNYYGTPFQPNEFSLTQLNDQNNPNIIYIGNGVINSGPNIPNIFGGYSYVDDLQVNDNGNPALDSPVTITGTLSSSDNSNQTSFTMTGYISGWNSAGAPTVIASGSGFSDVSIVV